MTTEDTIPTAEPGPRLGRGTGGQARARETRRRVLVAAATQFDALGYQGASMNTVAAHAGVTKGALYFHFPTKRALAEAVIAERNITWTAMVAQVTAHELDPLQTILAIADAVAVCLCSDPLVRGGNRLFNDPCLQGGRIAEITAEQFHAAHIALLAHLTDAAHAGLLRPGINHDARVRLARGVIATFNGHHLICQFTHTGGSGPTVLNELWERVTEMWLDLLPLIATEDWLAHFNRDDWAHRPKPPSPGPADPATARLRHGRVISGPSHESQ
jgi:AcrR family transcriptional regulator